MAYDTTRDVSPQMAQTDDAEKVTNELHGKHVIAMTLAQHKKKDLTESTGVVPAEYPPKVKLELLTTLEC